MTVDELFGRQFAFIVLERIGGVVIYEVTDPAEPRFVQYMNMRVFGVAGAAPCRPRAVEDLGPEGVIVIKEEDSPDRQAAARGRQRNQRDDADLRDLEG